MQLSPDRFRQTTIVISVQSYLNHMCGRTGVASQRFRRRLCVLELACGTGIVTGRLFERLGPKAKLVATDLNDSMLHYAAAKLGSETSVEWKEADATDLPFLDRSFDAVVCQFGLIFFS